MRHSSMWYLAFSMIRHVGLRDSKAVVQSTYEFIAANGATKEELDDFLLATTHIARLLKGTMGCYGPLPAPPKKESVILDMTAHTEDCPHCKAEIEARKSTAN